MSEIVTPSQANPSPTPATETPVAEPRRARDRIAGVAAELKARLAAKREAEESDVDDDDSDDDDEDEAPVARKPKAKTEAKPSSTSKVEAKVDAIEAAGGKAPEQKASESDKDYELRLSKKLGELEATRRELAKAKKEAETSGGELAKLKKLLDDGKANPLSVLEHLGIDYEALTKGIVEDRFKAPEKRLELPPDVQARLDRFEKADKEREANELRAQAEKQQAKDVAAVSKFLEDNAEDFPLASSMPWAAAKVIADAYAAGETSAQRALQELEEGLGQNFQSLMATDRSLKAAIKKNPALRASILKALDMDGPAAPATKTRDEDEDAPRGLGSVSTDQPARAPKSRAEQIASAVAKLKAKRAAEAESEDEDDDF